MAYVSRSPDDREREEELRKQGPFVMLTGKEQGLRGRFVRPDSFYIDDTASEASSSGDEDGRKPTDSDSDDDADIGSIPLAGDYEFVSPYTKTFIQTFERCLDYSFVLGGALSPTAFKPVKQFFLTIAYGIARGLRWFIPGLKHYSHSFKPASTQYTEYCDQLSAAQVKRDSARLRFLPDVLNFKYQYLKAYHSYLLDSVNSVEANPEPVALEVQPQEEELQAPVEVTEKPMFSVEEREAMYRELFGEPPSALPAQEVKADIVVEEEKEVVTPPRVVTIPGYFRDRDPMQTDFLREPQKHHFHYIAKADQDCVLSIAPTDFNKRYLTLQGHEIFFYGNKVGNVVSGGSGQYLRIVLSKDASLFAIDAVCKSIRIHTTSPHRAIHSVTVKKGFGTANAFHKNNLTDTDEAQEGVLTVEIEPDQSVALEQGMTDLEAYSLKSDFSPRFADCLSPELIQQRFAANEALLVLQNENPAVLFGRKNHWHELDTLIGNVIEYLGTQPQDALLPNSAVTVEDHLEALERYQAQIQQMAKIALEQGTALAAHEYNSIEADITAAYADTKQTAKIAKHYLDAGISALSILHSGAHHISDQLREGFIVATTTDMLSEDELSILQQLRPGQRSFFAARIAEISSNPEASVAQELSKIDSVIDCLEKTIVTLTAHGFESADQQQKLAKCKAYREILVCAQQADPSAVSTQALGLVLINNAKAVVTLIHQRTLLRNSGLPLGEASIWGAEVERLNRQAAVLDRVIERLQEKARLCDSLHGQQDKPIHVANILRRYEKSREYLTKLIEMTKSLHERAILQEYWCHDVRFDEVLERSQHAPAREDYRRQLQVAASHLATMEVPCTLYTCAPVGTLESIYASVTEAAEQKQGAPIIETQLPGNAAGRYMKANDELGKTMDPIARFISQRAEKTSQLALACALPNPYQDMKALVRTHVEHLDIELKAILQSKAKHSPFHYACLVQSVKAERQYFTDIFALRKDMSAYYQLMSKSNKVLALALKYAMSNTQQSHLDKMAGLEAQLAGEKAINLEVSRIMQQSYTDCLQALKGYILQRHSQLAKHVPYPGFDIKHDPILRDLQTRYVRVKAFIDGLKPVIARGEQIAAARARAQAAKPDVLARKAAPQATTQAEQSRRNHRAAQMQQPLPRQGSLMSGLRSVGNFLGAVAQEFVGMGEEEASPPIKPRPQPPTSTSGVK